MYVILLGFYELCLKTKYQEKFIEKYLFFALNVLFFFQEPRL